MSPRESTPSMKIGKTYKDSVPEFPPPVRARAGSPNILLVLLDDVGFGQPGTFGGPVPTPTLDRVAANGLRYNQFHTTALCSPTRAALLTGRNHHSVGYGVIAEQATGFPGYNSIIPKSAACVAEVLKQNGYNTAAFGKWHNTPTWQSAVTGPFEHWPTGMGFERFYGFLAGETDQWYPSLVENTTPVNQPRQPEEGYHLTTDLADQAIQYIRRQKMETPDKPFFVYLSTGACHAPHHAPREWIEKFKGKFDQGWDAVREETLGRQKGMGVVPEETELTPRPAEIPSWDSCSADEKRLYARMMEVFAGFLAHTDHEIGRVVDCIEELRMLEDTLIIYVAGDNGPSAEGSLSGAANEIKALNGLESTLEQVLPHIDELGGPLHSNHYPVGWAWAGSSPFQWTKQICSHFGGTRNGLAMSWPRGIKERGLRSQFHHVIDIVPTLYEIAGIDQPTHVNGTAQQPMDGVSMNYTFSDAESESARKTQYFEMFGARAVYHEGFVAGTRHGRIPWKLMHATGDFENDVWELYDVREDFSQAKDLARQMPDKLRELQEIWRVEAEKYQVFPLDDRLSERMSADMRPSMGTPRDSYVLTEGMTRFFEASFPMETQHEWQIEVEFEITDATEPDGVLAARGGLTGGWTLCIQSGVLHYRYNYFGENETVLRGRETLGAGRHRATYHFKPESGALGAGGLGTMTIDDGIPVSVRIEKTVPFSYGLDSFDIGMDSCSPVSLSYKPPFRFKGRIERVVFVPDLQKIRTDEVRDAAA